MSPADEPPAPPAGKTQGAPSQALMEILHAMPVGVEIYDKDFNALFFNSVSDELFLYRDRVLQFDDWWPLGFPDPVVRAQVIAEWQVHVANAERHPDQVQEGEWTVLCRDGRQHIVQFRLRRVGEIYILVLLDVTERRQMEAELRRLATVDPLTACSIAAASWMRRRRPSKPARPMAMRSPCSCSTSTISRR